MIGWLQRWWKEDTSREELHAAELELRTAIAKATEEAVRSKYGSELAIERTRRLIKTAEEAISTIKRQETGE